MFNDKSTHNERQEALQTVMRRGGLDDGEEVHSAPQLNKFLARSTHEFKVFQQVILQVCQQVASPKCPHGCFAKSSLQVLSKAFQQVLSRQSIIWLQALFERTAGTIGIARQPDCHICLCFRGCSASQTTPVYFTGRWATSITSFQAGGWHAGQQMVLVLMHHSHDTAVHAASVVHWDRFHVGRLLI